MAPRNAPRDALSPLELFPARSVPKAGHYELVEYRDRQETYKANFGLWSILGATSVGMMWFLAMMGPLGWGPFCCLLMLSLWGAGKNGAKLLFGEKLWQALPDGASIRTAQLEDGLKRDVLDWNADAAGWNDEADAWRADALEWRGWQEGWGERPLEWSEAFSATRGASLSARADGLFHDRAALTARREAIARRLKGLASQLEAGAPPKALPAPEGSE